MTGSGRWRSWLKQGTGGCTPGWDWLNTIMYSAERVDAADWICLCM
jgi:hypothetical protein